MFEKNSIEAKQVVEMCIELRSDLNSCFSAIFSGTNIIDWQVNIKGPKRKGYFFRPRIFFRYHNDLFPQSYIGINGRVIPNCVDDLYDGVRSGFVCNGGELEYLFENYEKIKESIEMEYLSGKGRTNDTPECWFAKRMGKLLCNLKNTKYGGKWQ